MRQFVMLAALVASRLGAQDARAARPIQDNSFLLEEAYNQERGVVQHISNLFFDRAASNWSYLFTDEWPLGSQRHQLSLTLPVVRAPAGGAALGDVALNYRLQMIGSGDTRLAVTPRLTVVLPTAGSPLGGGTFAVQAALASSYAAAPRLVLHSNAGVAVSPRAGNGAGASTRLIDVIVAQSAVWLVHPRVNVLLEGVAVNAEDFTGAGVATRRATGITLSPGLRWSHDFASGLQIVPGFAFPIGFRAYDAQRGVFLYLSFEHAVPGLGR